MSITDLWDPKELVGLGAKGLCSKRERMRNWGKDRNRKAVVTQEETDYFMTHSINPKGNLIENTVPPTSARSTAR